MARYVCDNCGATVVDEEFCPTCGSWIDTIAQDDDDYEEFDLEEGPPPAPRLSRGEPILCPSCGAPNPSTNRHCEECGARLRQGPLPTAPRPGVQTPAGVRALGALVGLILAIGAIAFLINLFSNDEPSSNTTLAADGSTTTVTPVVVENPNVLDILNVDCDPDGLGGDFACANLIDDNPGSFQVNYVDLPDAEKVITIRITFAQPVEITRIVWTNLEDESRFRRNYRAKGIELEAEGNPFQFPQELQDAPGEQSFDFATISANFLEITIQSVYQAEVVDGTEPFDELAIEGITVIGRPVQTPVTSATTGATTTAP